MWCAIVLMSPGLSAQDPAPPSGAKARPAPTNELDIFMEKVLARREVNRKTLDQYILDEVEQFEILGPGRWPLYRTKRDYTWYVRDGMHVRSPVRFNGVKVGDEARERYEARWIRRERERRERKAKKEEGKEEKSSDITIGPDGVAVNVGGNPVPTEPRFVSEAYFMDFKFEAGNYYLAGREKLEGQDVLKIEYYPTTMFGDSDERKGAGQEAKGKQPQDQKNDRQSSAEARAQRREKDVEQDIERRMNKTALITLWVDPTIHQIVKYTFDNVWLDFLPAGWLVKIDDIRASMTMGQPFPGVWLPRELNIHSGITLANGSFEGGYGRKFAEYRLAEVATKMRVPKKDDDDPEPQDHGPFVREVGNGGDFRLEPEATTDNATTDMVWLPALAGRTVEQAGQPEVVGEIRIHGNAFLTDTEVIDFASIALGQPLPAAGCDAITKRPKDSGRFQTVDVRKRDRSHSST